MDKHIYVHHYKNGTPACKNQGMKWYTYLGSFPNLSSSVQSLSELVMRSRVFKPVIVAISSERLWEK